LWTSPTTATTTLKDARLVIAQNNGGGITDTQTVVELGSAQTTTGTSYGILTSPKVYYYDTDNYSGTVATYFEATLKGSTGGVTATAALSSDSTCSSTISGSAVTVTGTAWTLSRSSAITLPSDAEYFVCFKTSSGTASVANAKLLVYASGSIDKVQTVQQLLPYEATDADATYTSQSPLNLLTKANFAGDHSYYYLDTVIKTSSGTGYIQLYNATDSSAITGSELTTTSTSFERKYSSDLDSNLTTAKNYVAQLKGGASNTVTVANAWIVVQISLTGASQQPFQGPTNEKLMRGGRWFNNGVLQPFTF
jgi:hypothetical protein